MKPLEELTNVEKAELLFDLFPSMIPGLLRFTLETARVISEDKELQRKSWNNKFIAFDLWFAEAVNIKQAIEHYGEKLEKSRSLFAKMMFEGYRVIFMTEALYFYTQVRKCENEKFTEAVKLLFN